MRTIRFSASLVALVTVAALIAASPAHGAILGAKSVGEIVVDAQGRASGENLATRILESEGVLEGFRAVPLGTVVFESVRIAGFTPSEKIAGVGSSALTLKGSNAIVTLHDNAHSVVQVKTLAPTSVSYALAPGVEALQEGRYGALVKLTHVEKGELGHLVAVGTEGPYTRGEVVQVLPGEVVARAQAGSELVFLAKAAAGRSDAFQRALVDALAEGSLVSHAVTEFAGSRVAASQVDVGSHAVARTTTLASGIVETTLAARAQAPSVLAYDLAYETLPARSADDVAVYVDGALVTRLREARDVLASARAGVPASYAVVAAGRMQVLVAGPQGAGEHRVTLSVGASATTESQSRAESSGDDDARVYGGFEYHANGKLTGDFLTSVIPEGRATLLSFTALATRTELFRSASLDGGVEATFHASGEDELRLETPKADLTLVDDAHATILVAAKAPVDAAFELASGVRARRLVDGAGRACGTSASSETSSCGVVELDGPQGPAGALVLVGVVPQNEAEKPWPAGHGSLGGDARLALEGANRVVASLAAGDVLLFRGAPDGHASEEAVLRAIAEGAVSGQALAGVQEGVLVARATSFVEGTTLLVRPEGRVLRVDHRLGDGEARSFVLDTRGPALVAKSASDVRVRVDGVTLAPSARVEDALAGDGPAYFAQTSLEGALRVVVRTQEAASTVLVDSLVEEAARAQARTDSFGAFKLFHDGTAVGSFVTLKADHAAGAVSGFTMVAAGQPIFASLVAGHSPFAATGADGASVLRLENREAVLEFSDSTNGFMKIVAREGTDAAFHLAGGLRPEPRGPGVVELVSPSGEHVASLLVARGGTLEAQGVGEVRARLAQGGEILFRTHAGIESELSTAQRTMINQAIASGRVAGQVIVQTEEDAAGSLDALERTARTESEGLATQAHGAFGALTSTVTASYGDVQILTAATRTRVDLTIASTSETGKTLLVSLDPDTIPGMAQGRATIRFDGKIAGQAASYADILDAEDDGDAAEYFVLAGDAGTQVLVSIPSFSVHTVTLEQRSEKPDTLYMYATLFLGLLVIVESALLAHGARKKHTIHNRRP